MRRSRRYILWLIIISITMTTGWSQASTTTTNNQPTVAEDKPEVRAEVESPSEEREESPESQESQESQEPQPYEERDPEAKLQDTAERWIRKIAEEHKLAPWRTADFHIEPLGPGTHSWLVHVLDQQTPVGYMIITALEEGGFRLAEYGVGDRPIFHLDTLRTSLVQLGMINTVTTTDQLLDILLLPNHDLVEPAVHKEGEPQLMIERHYLYPFAAYWKVTNLELKQTVYFDAITGEQYPLVKDPTKKPPGSTDIEYQPTQLSGLKDRMQLSVFDPYEDLGWIVEEPLLIQSIDDVITPLREKQRMTLTVELYDELILMPFPIIGYAQWDQAEAYLLIYSEGMRYVPLIDAIRFGRIYIEDQA